MGTNKLLQYLIWLKSKTVKIYSVVQSVKLLLALSILSNCLRGYQDQAIIVGTVLTNIGNAYNSSTGTFMCPVSGKMITQSAFEMMILPKIATHPNDMLSRCTKLVAFCHAVQNYLKARP